MTTDDTVAKKPMWNLSFSVKDTFCMLLNVTNQVNRKHVTKVFSKEKYTKNDDPKMLTQLYLQLYLPVI